MPLASNSTDKRLKEMSRNNTSYHDHLNHSYHDHLNQSNYNHHHHQPMTRPSSNHTHPQDGVKKNSHALTNGVGVGHPHHRRGDAPGQPQTSRHLNLRGEYEVRSQPAGLHHRPIVKPAGNDADSELITAFDPMKDRHLWTMWRTAVNGRIVDEVRRLEKIKTDKPPEVIRAEMGAPLPAGPYGTSLVVPPLRRFIKFDEESKEIAQNLMRLGQGRLQTTQFVYYGLPRVYISQPPSQQERK